MRRRAVVMRVVGSCTMWLFAAAAMQLVGLLMGVVSPFVFWWVVQLLERDVFKLVVFVQPDDSN